MRLILRPIALREARYWVQSWHRHHKAPQGGKFALSAWRDDRPTMPQETLVGVVIVGRPVSRMLDDGLTAEVIRVATDGTRNANSFLYGAAKRAAQAMGYTKIITYTLPEESGVSLRAVGWTNCGLTRGGAWSRESRPRLDNHPTQAKIRWEAIA